MDAPTYICPTCQQDALLKGEAQYVCINCGYSTSIDDKSIDAAKPSAKPPKASAVQSKADLKPSEVKPSAVPVVPSGGDGPLVVQPPAVLAEATKEQAGQDKLIIPPSDTNVAMPRKLSRVVGEQRVEQLTAVSGISRDFLATYRQELNELFGPGVLRFVKFTAIVVAGLIVVFMAYTFLQ